MVVRVIKAILKILEAPFRAAGISGPNSRERVREKIVVVLNGREIRQ